MFRRKGRTKQKRLIITEENSLSFVSEQYRTIRTNIQFSSVDQEFKTILVTSAVQEEGKSFTVSNLAVVFAQQGKKVLIVDADLRKPTVHYSFNIPNQYGLTNVLTKQIEFKKAISKTNIENLFALTSGPIPPNPSELLASHSMEELIQQVTQDYDFVLFDTPPLLAVTDSQILSNLCEGSVLVIASGRTEIEKVAKARDMLAAAKGKLLGAVLNNKKMPKGNQYYYYGTK